MNTPIYSGLAQSDLDMAGFDILNAGNVDVGGVGGGGDITPIVSGQDWIAVTFDEVQSDALWTFTQLLVVNTVDAPPLKISPAILTRKTTTGFRLQLSAAADTANYALHWNFSGTGGGSAVGGGYTILDTTVSGDNTRLVIPTVRVPGTALVWCHGLGGGYSDLDPVGNAMKLYYLNAVAGGYLQASGDFGGYNWDNPTAQAKVEALVAYLVANYGVNQVVMYGGSAGGPVSLLKATQGFTGVTVKGWHNIYPVVNLDAAHSNAALTASINAAFPGYPTGTAGRDPILFAASAYDGLRLRCCQSAADTVTPKSIHGDALVTLATGHATEVTCLTVTGDHGDVSSYTQALADDFLAFLNRCF
jgi:hypothetical protein